MRKLLFIPVLLCGISASRAQRVIDLNKDPVNAVALLTVVGSAQLSNAKYIQVVAGTPYFNEGWSKGTVLLNDSSEVTNLLLKLDLLTNNIEYISKTGEHMVVTAPIKMIRLTDSITGRQTYFFHSSTISVPNVSPGWYQLLASGKITVYKKIHKEIQENKPYGSATVEQTITSSNQYFIQTTSSFTRIKKIKDLPDLLPDKKTQLTTFIKENGLTGKADQDFISVAGWYNNQ